MNVYVFREALEYSIQCGFAHVRDKNEKNRISICCDSERCDWRVHAFVMTNDVNFKIETYNPDHTYIINQKSRPAKWMFRKL